MRRHHDFAVDLVKGSTDQFVLYYLEKKGCANATCVLRVGRFTIVFSATELAFNSQPFIYAAWDRRYDDGINISIHRMIADVFAESKYWENPGDDEYLTGGKYTNGDRSLINTFVADAMVLLERDGYLE